MALDDVVVEEPENKDAYLKLAQYPLIKHTDMESEMRAEATEICTSAVEKFPTNMEKSSQYIKDAMDKKFGAPWNVVLGEYFSFEVTSEVKHLLYMFCGGTNALLVWKSQ